MVTLPHFTTTIRLDSSGIVVALTRTMLHTISRGFAICPEITTIALIFTVASLILAVLGGMALHSVIMARVNECRRVRLYRVSRTRYAALCARQMVTVYGKGDQQ